MLVVVHVIYNSRHNCNHTVVEGIHFGCARSTHLLAPKCISSPSCFLGRTEDQNLCDALKLNAFSGLNVADYNDFTKLLEDCEKLFLSHVNLWQQTLVKITRCFVCYKIRKAYIITNKQLTNNVVFKHPVTIIGHLTSYCHHSVRHFVFCAIGMVS